MKVSGNARIYLNRFEGKNGPRISLAVRVASKKKDRDEYNSVYIGVALSKELQKRINEKTPSKFDVYIKDASLICHEYNGTTSVRLYIADWEHPHDEAPKYEEKKTPNFEEIKSEEELPF